MRARALCLSLAIFVLSATPSLGQITARVRPPVVAPPAGTLDGIAIEVDMGSTGKTLGSFGVILTWDPTVLQYLGDSGGGDPPFSSVVINRTAVGSGRLRFSAASPTGATGVVNIMNVTYGVLVEPCVLSRIDLEFTSLGATGPGFENLLPLLKVEDGFVRATDFIFDLRANDPATTTLSWSSVPPGRSYDAIRGQVANLSLEGLDLHLGPVVCLENDSSDTTTGSGAEAPHADADIPAPGEAFFYLVRYYDGVANGDYVFSARCVARSLVESGDCQ